MMEFIFIFVIWVFGGVCAVLAMKYRSKKIVKNAEEPVKTESEEKNTLKTELELSKSSSVDWENSTVNCMPTKHLASLNSCNKWTIDELFEKVDIKVKEFRTEFSYIIGFEGKAFLFEHEALDDFFHLELFNIFFTNYRWLNKTLMVANELNKENDTWSCYIKLSPEGFNELPVRVCLKCKVKLSEKLADMERELRETLQESSFISCKFHETFKNMERKDVYDHISAESADYYNLVAYLQRTKEMGHGKIVDPEEYDADKSMMALHFLRHFDMSAVGNLVSMRLVYENHIDTVHDSQKISEFDVYQFLKQEAATSPVEQMTVYICYEKQTFCINICRLEGSTVKSLFYMLYISQLPVVGTSLGEPVKVNSYQTQIEIRLSDGNSDYWEAKYMLDDAHDKLKFHDKSKLTDEQCAMLAVMDTSLSFDMYLGKKLYNEKAYHQALEHFMKIFDYYRLNWKSIKPKDKQTYQQLGLFIGFIYMEWDMPDKAYYYLNIAKENGSIASIQEYINSLCQMRDPRSVSEISRYILGTLTSIKMAEEEREDLDNFYTFLCKRMAYVLIEIGNLEQAEMFLHQMIKGKVAVDFAKQELKYLSSITSHTTTRWDKVFFDKEQKNADEESMSSDTDPESDDKFEDDKLDDDME